MINIVQYLLYRNICLSIYYFLLFPSSYSSLYLKIFSFGSFLLKKHISIFFTQYLGHWHNQKCSSIYIVERVNLQVKFIMWFRNQFFSIKPTDTVNMWRKLQYNYHKGDRCDHENLGGAMWNCQKP